jgi:hypothetical protein
LLDSGWEFESRSWARPGIMFKVQTRLSEPQVAQAETRTGSGRGWPQRLLESVSALLRSVKVRRRERSLRVCETLPLGDKRFVAVIQCEGRRLLIGATSQSISVLDRLDSNLTTQKREPSFEKTFRPGVH